MYRSKFNVYKRVSGEGRLASKDSLILKKDTNYNDEQVADMPSYYVDYLERI